MLGNNQLKNSLDIKDDSHTISFKVGRAILDARSLKGIVQLPFKLYETRELYLLRKFDKEIINALRNYSDLSVSHIYKEHGLKGLVALSKLQLSDSKVLSKELIKFASSIEDEDRLLISKLALELDHSLAVLRGAAWSGVHFKNTAILEDIIELIEKSENKEQEQYKKTYQQFSKKLEEIKHNQKNEKGLFNSNKFFFSLIKKKTPSRLQLLDLNSALNMLHKNEAVFTKLVHCLYLKGGIIAVQKLIDKMFASFNTTQRAFLYLKAGKVLSEMSVNAEYQLAMIAIATDDHTTILRGALWASIRKNDEKKTVELIDTIESRMSDNPSKKEIEFIKKMHKVHAYTLSIERHIKDEGEYLIKPKKGRVAYVLHNSLPFSSGGYATRAFGLSCGLKDLGFDVHVINRPGFPIDINTGLELSQVDSISVINDIPHIITLSPTRRHKSPYDYMLAAADSLESRFREYRPEIVVAASNHITAIPALIAASRLGIPFIYEVRGFWEITRVSREPEFESHPSFRAMKLLEAMAAKHAQHVFTLTQPMKEELITRGIDSNKITLLPNSCNPEEFVPRRRNQDLAKQLSIPSHIPVIGYIGTFVQYEGLEHLVEACALLKNKGVEFRLLIVGNENASGSDRGPITEAIIQTALANEMLDWVILPGRVPHDEVSNYYSLIDIAPFPRKPQPVCEMVSPMKPLEAAAMKKAIVVSSVKALQEMITHEKNGLVFEKGNIFDLATQLERLISDAELRHRLGENARVWVETERTWSITANTMKDVLNQVIENVSIT